MLTEGINTRREVAALVVTSLVVLLTAIFDTKWSGTQDRTCQIAVVLGGMTTVALWLARSMGYPGIKFEKRCLAYFLAAMPLVYVLNCLEPAKAATSPAWIAIELSGLIAFGFIAWLGLKRSPWYLAAGIAGHGLAWDIWHFPISNPCVPAWYASLCFAVDIGLSLYVAARIRTWKSEALARRPKTAMQTT